MRPGVGALILLFVKKADIKQEDYVSTVFSIHRRILFTDSDVSDKDTHEVFSESELFFALFCGLLVLIAVATMEVEASKLKSGKIGFAKCTRAVLSKKQTGKENSSNANNSTQPTRAKPKLLSEIDTSRIASPILEGNVSQVFKIYNSASEIVSIFKPYSTKTKQSSLALSSKEHCINEVMAYKVDKMTSEKYRANVPETRHVQLPSSMFDDKTNGSFVKGSLQRFLNSSEVSENFGSSVFSKDDVFNVALLDIKILNCDRHPGNLLFQKSDKKLFPIDHALSFPEIEIEQDLTASPYLTGDMSDKVLYLRNVSYDWLMFPQVKEKFPEEYYQVIRNIEIEEQLSLMKRMGYNVKQRLACFSALQLLKVGALKHDKTLFEIGSMVQRQGSRKSPSILESLVSQTLKSVNKTKLVSGNSNEIKMYKTLFKEKVEEFFTV